MCTINNQVCDQEIKALKVEKVHGADTFEILSIALEKGGIFPEHTSPRKAILVLLEGSIRFHIDGNSYLLKRHQLFNFPKNTPHWVEAKRDSKFLIIR